MSIYCPLGSSRRVLVPTWVIVAGAVVVFLIMPEPQEPATLGER